MRNSTFDVITAGQNAYTVRRINNCDNEKGLFNNIEYW